MLTGPRAVLVARTARALPVRSIVALAALSTAPAVMTYLRGGDDFTGAMVAATVLGGAGLAYALDDDAEVVLAASPTPLAVRRALRIAIAFGVLGAAWVAVLLLVAVASDAPVGDALDALALDGWTAASCALAVAAIAHRSLAVERPGLAGTVAGALSVLVVTTMAVRYPELPTLMAGDHHERWLWLALAGSALAVWASRDPARR